MKSAILLSIIVLTLGSITKTPEIVLPCGRDLEEKFFQKGKLVHYHTIKYKSESKNQNVYIKCYWCNSEFYSDSCMTKVNFKTKK